MKYLAMLIAVALVGCSSAQKKSQTTSQPEAKASADSATSKADNAKATKTAAPADGEKLTCTHGKDSRQLEVDKKDSGCTLNYTKAGETKAIANAKNGTQYCDDARDKIRGKLEKSGFECK